MIRSAAESGESAEHLGLLAVRVAQTHVLPIDAATLRQCCAERASQPAAPPRVRRTGCGLLGPDVTAGQPGRLSTIEGLAGLVSGVAIQAVRERRARTMTASTSAGPRVSKADRFLALAKQHHERRDAARWQYLLRAGRIVASCLSAGASTTTSRAKFKVRTPRHCNVLVTTDHALLRYVTTPPRPGAGTGRAPARSPRASRRAEGGAARGRLRISEHRL